MLNQSVVDALRQIPKKSGLLLPEDVVKAAKPVSSPLHSKFDWNDTTAAHAHRLWQARQLISVVVEYLDNDKCQPPVEMFVSLTSDRKTGGGYRLLEVVLADDERRAQLLADALEELERFQLKYEKLQELAAVFEAIVTVKHHSKSKKKSA